MPERFYLYYVTDRSAFGADERTRRDRLLQKIAEVASQSVDFVQLREKDLSARELESLAREAARIIQENSPSMRRTALLINSRTDVALASRADGVHLRSEDVSAAEVRSAWGHALPDNPAATPLISVACHSAKDVAQAFTAGADFALFAPVLDKPILGKTNLPSRRPLGLDDLRQACLTPIPVLALGGVNLQNAESCRMAGAAGIAGIRLFQENDVSAVVRALRPRWF
jgi:thiamine-phosphate pyrophosphorylase